MVTSRRHLGICRCAGDAALVAVPAGPDPTESSIVVQQPQQDQPQSSASDGFDWANAGIAATVALGLLCVGGATLLLTTRTRRRTA